MTITPNTAAQEPTIHALAAELPAALSALRRGFRRRAAGRGPLFGPLTGAQAELAQLVRHRPGVSVAVAAAELQLSANTVSTLVRQLSEMGLLVRESDPADRRVARLRLTERARIEIRRWQDQQAQQVAAALRRLSGGQVRALAAAIPALSALVDELANEAEDPT
jgi:DNA-binding MarR family transcriptional regulator